MLKAPISKRSKPEHDKLVSNFAFEFSLRRYITAFTTKSYSRALQGETSTVVGGNLVGQCRLTLSNPR
jgi:hypothetical protein